MKFASALNVRQMGTPPNPSAGESLIYPKSDGAWYTKGSDGVEKPVGGAASGSDSGWLNLTLSNGWVNYDSGLTSGGSGRAAQVRKIGGVVYFRGVIRNNVTANYNAFAIPAGYRPGVTTIYEYSTNVAASGGYASININASTGDLLVGAAAGSNPLAFTYLTGIIYPAA